MIWKREKINRKTNEEKKIQQRQNNRFRIAHGFKWPARECCVLYVMVVICWWWRWVCGGREVVELVDKIKTMVNRNDFTTQLVFQSLEWNPMRARRARLQFFFFVLMLKLKHNRPFNLFISCNCVLISHLISFQLNISYCICIYDSIADERWRKNHQSYTLFACFVLLFCSRAFKHSQIIFAACQWNNQKKKEKRNTRVIMFNSQINFKIIYKIRQNRWRKNDNNDDDCK